MTRCVYPHKPNDGQERTEHEAKHGYLCESGYRRLERHIAELPALSAWLHANLPRTGTGGYGDFTTGSKEMPLVIRDGIADHEGKILTTVNSWARLIAEERDLRGPWKPLPPDGRAERDRLRRAVEQTATLNELVMFLLAHLPWAAEQAWIDDLCDELQDLTADGHKLAPSRPGRHRVQAPCPDPECNLAALVRVDGSAYVECEGCGRLWTEDEWLRLAVIMADDLPKPEQREHHGPHHVEEGHDARIGRREAS